MRCLPDSPYGCNHFKEHQRAARKGWITRRRNAKFKNPEEHKAFTAIVGSEVSHIHLHPQHAGKIRFQTEGKWYEITPEEYRRLLRQGRTLLREEEQFRKKAERENARREAQHERELARKKTLEEREAARKQREEERQRAGLAHYEAMEERRQQRYARAQYKDVVRHIRGIGGIRPNRANSKGKIPELAEWRALPRSVKTRSEREGFPLDEVTADVQANFPGLPIRTDEDLRVYLMSKGRKFHAA